jgi:hypothetical protein
VVFAGSLVNPISFVDGISMVEPVCPHCGASFREEIPTAIEDPILIKCQMCEMVYEFNRNESECIDESQYYFSEGFFRRNPIQMDARQSSGETAIMNRTCLLCFCIIGPLLLFGLLFLLDFILRLFGLF